MLIVDEPFLILSKKSGKNLKLYPPISQVPLRIAMIYLSDLQVCLQWLEEKGDVLLHSIIELSNSMASLSIHELNQIFRDIQIIITDIKIR